MKLTIHEINLTLTHSSAADTTYPWVLISTPRTK